MRFSRILAVAIVFGLALFIGPAQVAHGATLTVDSTADDADFSTADGFCDTDDSVGDGPCTLRAAIEQANFDAGTDTIAFSIAGAGAHTILVGSELPKIIDTVIIDGTTQGCALPTPCIVLDGSLIPLAPPPNQPYTFQNGLILSSGGSSGSTIKGLLITAFGNRGITLSSTGNLITAVGVTGNGFPNGCQSGISLGGGNTISSSLISGNCQNGIVIGGSNNFVIGNAIGTDITGTSALANGRGILIEAGDFNTIGTLAAPNLISGNNSNGIQIQRSTFSSATGNVVAYNFIGTDITGTFAIGNGSAGVRLKDGAIANVIGGANGEGNLISGNGNGVSMGSGAEDNRVEGNLIGTKIDGVNPLPNTWTGVSIGGSQNSHRNVVGGPGDPCVPVFFCEQTLPGTANTIAHNGGDGVSIRGDQTVRGNNIFDNGLLGIDFNDPINYPPGDGPPTPFYTSQLRAAMYGSVRLLLTGYIYDAPPNTALSYDVFVNTSCDSSGYGEGETWISGVADTGLFVTDANGDISAAGFVYYPSTDFTGMFATITATLEIPGYGKTTSEFSDCVAIQADSDSDHIQDEIDGTCVGAVFTSQSGVGSPNFTDECQPGGGATFGFFEPGALNPDGRNGCLTSVIDLPAPEGILLTANCSAGTAATFKMCADARPIKLQNTETAIEKCGSNTTHVDFGPVTTVLGTIETSLPTNTTTTTSDLGGGDYQIVTDSANAVSITVGGLSIAPGETIVVDDNDGDGFVAQVDNCPDTANSGQENDVHPGTPAGDHCEDPEPDSVFDIVDNCPDIANPSQAESDGDDIGDACEVTETSFDVSYDASVADTTPDVARATTTTLTVPHPGSINFADLITFDPAATITQTCNTGLVGGLATTHTAGGPCLRATDLAGTVSLDLYIGTLNNGCTTNVVVDFDLFAVPTPDTPADPRASGNIAYTQPVGTGDRFARWGTSPIGAGGGTAVAYTGLKADADNIAFKNYPEFLLDLYDADGPAGGGNPLVPLAVYGAISDVSGDSIPIYIVTFEPGALAAEFAAPNPLGRATANLRYSSQTVLKDPTASSDSSGAVTAFCSTSVVTTLNATVGGVTRATNPALGTHFNLVWVASERDVDNDGVENSIDTCPFTRNTDPDPRTALGDPDGDLIDAACDPDGIGDTTTNAGADVDSDGWTNLEDSCVQTANASQLTSEVALGVEPGYQAVRADDGGPLGDGLGDACDSDTVNVTYNGINYPALPLSSTIANGRWQVAALVAPICYGGVDTDGDGYCATEDTSPFDPSRWSSWTTTASINAVLGEVTTLGAGSWDTDGGGSDPFTGGDFIPDVAFDSDWLETYVGTDARQPCALSTSTADEPLDAWLYDTNSDGKVTLPDVLSVGPYFGGPALASGALSLRYDWNADGFILLPDVLSVGPAFAGRCVPIVGPQ